MKDRNKDEFKIVKECRRAKRTKSFYAEGNLIPLSTQEKKAIRNRTYRKQKDKTEKTDLSFQLNYKKDVQAFVSPQSYNVKCGFNYDRDVSMYKCYKDATVILETLYIRGIIKNYFFVVDKEPNNSHTHFIINAVNPLTIMNYIRKMFNRFKQGYVWHKMIITHEELEDAIEYYTNKLDVDGWISQKGIDYWGIRTENIID